MAKPKRGANPFYVLLILVGLAFVVTASSYWMRAYSDLRPRDETAVATGGTHPLWTFLDAYGEKLLIGELIALAVLTFGAIATDDYWARRTRAERNTAAASVPPGPRRREPPQPLPHQPEKNQPEPNQPVPKQAEPQQPESQ